MDGIAGAGKRPNRTVNALGAMVVLRTCESVPKMTEKLGAWNHIAMEDVIMHSATNQIQEFNSYG